MYDGKLFFKPDEATRRALGLADGTLVPWVNGIPDFQNWAWGRKNFEIKSILTGVQKLDTEIIAKELAQQGWQGKTTQQAVLDEFTRLNLTPHHFQTNNGTHIIQLVDRDLHGTIRHSGTGAILRGGK